MKEATYIIGTIPFLSWRKSNSDIEKICLTGNCKITDIEELAKEFVSLRRHLSPRNTAIPIAQTYIQRLWEHVIRRRKRHYLFTRRKDFNTYARKYRVNHRQ